MTDELEFLAADLAEVERLLAQTPERSLDRIGLQRRRDLLAAELGLRGRRHLRAAATALMFDGGPVSGMEAIDAGFAAAVLASYQKMVSLIAADRARAGKLGMVGPVPEVAASRLLITGTPRGSFGFELKEFPSGQLDLDIDTPLKAAVDDPNELIASAGGEEEDDSFGQVNARVQGALRDFFETMQRHRAHLRVSSPAGEHLVDDAAVERAVERIISFKISEDELPLRGELRGLFLENRRFEFRIAGEEGGYGGVIRGKAALPPISRPWWAS